MATRAKTEKKASDTKMGVNFFEGNGFRETSDVVKQGEDIVVSF